MFIVFERDRGTRLARALGRGRDVLSCRGNGIPSRCNASQNPTLLLTCTTPRDPVSVASCNHAHAHNRPLAPAFVPRVATHTHVGARGRCCLVHPDPAISSSLLPAPSLSFFFFFFLRVPTSSRAGEPASVGLGRPCPFC